MADRGPMLGSTEPQSFLCCGVRIAALGPAEAVERLSTLAAARQSSGVHLCNAYTLSLAVRDRRFAELLDAGDANLADGTPVAWVGRLRTRGAVRGPVRGPGLMLDVMRHGVAWGARHYLYGGSPEVVERLRQRLPELVPGIELAGSESPPFRELSPAEENDMIARVRASGAHFVWVALGTPKQDRFVHRFAERFDAVSIPVGAAFDFAAGVVAEAPAWLHGTGLEWLHRFAQEPRRLWRRYLIGNSVFVLGVLGDIIGFRRRARRPDGQRV